jgi:hypothetical protein
MQSSKINIKPSQTQIMLQAELILFRNVMIKFVLFWKHHIFFDLGARAKFQDPRTTTSGILVWRKKKERRKLQKKMPLLSCSDGHTFALTKISKPADRPTIRD